MTTQDIQQLNPGGGQTILLKSDGTVWTWGDNVGGQLGTGMRADPKMLSSPEGVNLPPKKAFSSVPAEVDLPPIQQVAGGASYSIALSTNGTTIYSWGDNTYGELGTGSGPKKLAYTTTPVTVDLSLPPGVTVVSIAGGLNSAYALLSNGEVMAWGSNADDQTGRANGTITTKPQIVPGLTDVTAIAAGDNDALALEANGTVWAWGEDTYGELGPAPSAMSNSATPVQVTGLPPITMITSGGNDNVAVDASGDVYTWGRNEFGELGQGTIDPANGPHPTPTMVSGLTDIVSIDGEGPTTLAADASGNIYAFGDNSYGQVGDGTESSADTPTLVLTIPTSPDSSGPSVQVAAGHYFSYAFNVVTGQIYAWGQNTSGQLAIPRNYTPNPTPINVTSDILSGDNPGMARPTMAFLGAQDIHAMNVADGGWIGSTGDLVETLSGRPTSGEFHQMLTDLVPMAARGPDDHAGHDPAANAVGSGTGLLAMLGQPTVPALASPGHVLGVDASRAQ